MNGYRCTSHGGKVTAEELGLSYTTYDFLTRLELCAIIQQKPGCLLRAHHARRLRNPDLDPDLMIHARAFGLAIRNVTTDFLLTVRQGCRVL